MDPLRQRIAVARRRLNLERFGACLFRSWCAWLSVLLAVVVVRKLVPMAIDDRAWLWALFGGALAAGTITALVWTALGRHSELDAALEIDKRFGLKERVSSAVALDADSRETAAGQALLADAVQRVERLDVGSRFRVGLDRSAWWPLVPGSLAILIAVLISSRVPEHPAIAGPTASRSAQVKKAAQSLQKKLEQRREEARQKGLKETDALLKKLEEGTKDLGDKATADKEKALVKLNDLSKELEERRARLAGNEQLKQQLNQLKDLQKGPADDAARALKKGDFQEAAKALKRLQKKLADGKLNDQEKQQLAEQMKQMANTLQQAANAQQQAQQAVKDALEKAREQGDTQRATELQQQLEKLQKQQAAAKPLEKLAEQCKQCADAMSHGGTPQAGQALDQLQQQLNQMAQSQQEMQMLDQALDEIAQAKSSMAGNDLQQMDDAGEGQMALQGRGAKGSNRPGKGIGNQPGGNPLGKGENTKTGFYDSQVKQKAGKGTALVTDLVDGPNRKGTVTEEIQQAFENAAHSEGDPLTDQRLPRGYRDHAKEYFESLRKGKSEAAND